MKRRLLVAMAVLLVPLIISVLYGPGFLTHKEKPVKVDAVVLFVGPGNKDRLAEAKQLIREGHTRCLIIPAFGEIRHIADDGKELDELIAGYEQRGKGTEVRSVANVTKFYEATHIEALIARRIMDRYGFHTALLVSSPYHTRRIGMIAKLVFPHNSYTTACVPARRQRDLGVGDWLDHENRASIVSEYVKMAWFLLYGNFGSHRVV